MIRNLFSLTKTEWENIQYVNFWTQHSNYSKLDNFGRKKSLTTPAIFWCQKLPKINLYLTLFFVFLFFPKKSHFRNIFSRSTQKCGRTEPWFQKVLSWINFWAKFFFFGRWWKLVVRKSFKSKSGIVFFFFTLDGATIGTCSGVTFSWAILFRENSTQTAYEVSRGIRWQFFVFQMKSDMFFLCLNIKKHVKDLHCIK